MVLGIFRSLYGAGSPTAAVRELAGYKLDLVSVQGVRWDRGGTIRADYNFFYGKGNENRLLGTGLIVHHRIVSAVTTAEFVSDRVSYIVLRDRWFNIIVLNVHTGMLTRNSRPAIQKTLMQSGSNSPLTFH